MICILCKRQSSKGDTCYTCRERTKNKETRAVTNQKADAILTESPANAKIRAQETFELIKQGNVPPKELEKLWHEYRQAKANMSPRLTMD